MTGFHPRPTTETVVDDHAKLVGVLTREYLYGARLPAAGQAVREHDATLHAAYDAGDRVTAEELLDEDFRFSSPRDDRIDKRAWFERCWPNSDKLCAFRIERLCERDDGEVFVRYSAERVADGVRFRNIELWRVVEGRVREIDVYFGRDLQS